MFHVPPAPGDTTQETRWLDLRSGVLHRSGPGIRSLRFAWLADPSTNVLRVRTEAAVPPTTPLASLPTRPGTTTRTGTEDDCTFVEVAAIGGITAVAADVALGDDRVQATQVIKQADVLMLHHLLPEELPPGSLDKPRGQAPGRRGDPAARHRLHLHLRRAPRPGPAHDHPGADPRRFDEYGTVRPGSRCEALDEPPPTGNDDDHIGDDVRMRCADHRFAQLVEASLHDLAALRMHDPEAPEDVFCAAGSPWYLTLFGRDSLWTALMALPFDLALAGGTLRTLARRQGRRDDRDTEEAPGRILHEIRRGSLTHRGDLPPNYYGTIDATPGPATRASSPMHGPENAVWRTRAGRTATTASSSPTARSPGHRSRCRRSRATPTTPQCGGRALRAPRGRGPAVLGSGPRRTVPGGLLAQGPPWPLPGDRPGPRRARRWTGSPATWATCSARACSTRTRPAASPPGSPRPTSPAGGACAP